jgi:hypothetical protein
MNKTVKWTIGGAVAAAAVYFLFIRKAGASSPVTVTISSFQNQTLPVKVSPGQTLVIHAPSTPHMSLSYGAGIVGDPTESPDGTTINFPVTGTKATSPQGNIVSVGDGLHTVHLQLQTQ